MQIATEYKAFKPTVDEIHRLTADERVRMQCDAMERAMIHEQKTNEWIEELTQKVEKQSIALEEKDKTLAEQQQTLAEKDKEISRLKAELAAKNK